MPFLTSPLDVLPGKREGCVQSNGIKVDFSEILNLSTLYNSHEF